MPDLGSRIKGLGSGASGLGFRFNVFHTCVNKLVFTCFNMHERSVVGSNIPRTGCSAQFPQDFVGCFPARAWSRFGCHLGISRCRVGV